MAAITLMERGPAQVRLPAKSLEDSSRARSSRMFGTGRETCRTTGALSSILTSEVKMSISAVRPSTRVTGIAPQFLVGDLDRAIAYYCDKLGFQLDFTYQSFYAAVTRDGF